MRLSSPFIRTSRWFLRLSARRLSSGYRGLLSKQRFANRAMLELHSFADLTQSLHLNLDDLRKTLKKPLLPILLMQSHADPIETPSFLDGYHVVYLAVASRYCADGSEEASDGYVYIQGAGDDSESWALGLTPDMYWKHQDRLLQAREEELRVLIASIVQDSSARDKRDEILIQPTTNVFISSLALAEMKDDGNFWIVLCSPKVEESFQHAMKGRLLHLKCNAGKLGSRDLRKELPNITGFLSSVGPKQRILICCPTGLDLSIGVGLAILCLCTDDKGESEQRTRPNDG